MRHPPQDVGVAAEVREGTDFGVGGAQVSKKAADRPAIVANGFRIERRAERRDGAVEGISQWMLNRGSSRAVHDTFPGRGRMCWATARAYSR